MMSISRTLSYTSPLNTSKLSTQSAHTSPKALGALFENLIKAARQQGRQAITIATRMLQLWQSMPETVLRIEFDSLFADEELVLEMDEDQGMWMLPLFLGGVRSFTLNPWATSSDLAALGYMIASLRVSSQDVEGLRDWIWAGGASGIEIELGPTSLDVIDLLGVDPEAISRGFGRGDNAGASMMSIEPSGLKLDKEQLKAASLRPEFKTTLDLFSQGLKLRGFEATSTERQQLKAQAQDTERWRINEFMATIKTPQLRQLLGPTRILDQLLAGSYNAALYLHLFEQLQANDDFADGLKRALERPDISTRLGMLIPLSAEPKDLEVAALVLKHLNLNQTHEFLSILLQRVTRASELEGGMLALIKHVGVASLRKLMSEPSLSAQEAYTWIKLLLKSHIPPSQLSITLETIEDEVVVKLAPHLPDLYLMELERRLVQILEHGERRFIEELIVYLIGRRFESFIRLAALIMRDEQDLSWSRRTVGLVCQAIAAAQLSEEFLVPYVRDRGVAQHVREAALEVLEQNATIETLAAATKWRISELFDPTDFRERIKTDRKRSKTDPKAKPLDKD